MEVRASRRRVTKNASGMPSYPAKPEVMQLPHYEINIYGIGNNKTLFFAWSASNLPAFFKTLRARRRRSIGFCNFLGRSFKFMKNGKNTVMATLLWAGMFLLAISPAYGATLTATPGHTDFGTIDEGVNAVIKVIIENTGRSQVEITNVQTS